MDKSKAIKDIQSIFRQFKVLKPSDRAFLSSLNDGKLYELYVLSELVLDLRRHGFQLRFVGGTPKANTLKFKAAPGKIKLSDPHFEVTAPNSTRLWLFVDIEFQTLGKKLSHATDLSARHELDLMLVDDTPDYPLYDQIYLAVECKCVSKFKKKVVKEALGIRRELSYLGPKQTSLLTKIGGRSPVRVAADPASELWLAFIDGDGTRYAESPDAFGIDFKHIAPLPDLV